MSKPKPKSVPEPKLKLNFKPKHVVVKPNMVMVNPKVGINDSVFCRNINASYVTVSQVGHVLVPGNYGRC